MLGWKLNHVSKRGHMCWHCKGWKLNLLDIFARRHIDGAIRPGKSYLPFNTKSSVRLIDNPLIGLFWEVPIWPRSHPQLHYIQIRTCTVYGTPSIKDHHTHPIICMTLQSKFGAPVPIVFNIIISYIIRLLIRLEHIIQSCASQLIKIKLKLSIYTCHSKRLTGIILPSYSLHFIVSINS